MTTNTLDSLEDRIQKPGYLLLLVLVLLLLIIGLVDLIDFVHEENPIIFGRYDVRYFILLVLYTLVTLAWASLLLRPNDDYLLTGALDYIQMRPLLAIAVMFFLGLVIIALLTVAEILEGLVSTLPALQVTTLAITLLAAGIILFYKFGDESRPQWWRWIILVALGILLVIELLLHGLAYFRVLPFDLSTTQSLDDYSSYSRIYHTEEGFGSGLTNNYGRYAPDFELLPDSYRIAVLGDSFVEGIQVSKEQIFAVHLEERLVANGEQEQISEVLSLGHPNRGPGMYLSDWLLSVMIAAFDPNEAIIFFDMGSDFQTVDRAGTGYPYFVYVDPGKAEMDKSRGEWFDLHVAEHHVFRGYMGFQPGLTLKSNYLTFRLIWESISRYLAAGNTVDNAEVGPTAYDIDLPNGFMFNAETNENALKIASAQIDMAHEKLKDADIETRLVTNPVFTDAFYEQKTWNTTSGNSDLLLPELQLRESAAQNGIPFLGLGTYMQALGLSPADVQTYYFDEGRGHYTPEGHQFVAEAIYQCFYAQTLTAEEGCDLR
jgi:hypothetical protein